MGEAGNGDEAVAAASRLEPDLVLMDLRMPVRNGVDASAAILAARPSTRIVVLTTYVSDGEVLRAIEAGAVGYLLKDVPHEELFRALRAVARGRTVPRAGRHGAVDGAVAAAGASDAYRSRARRAALRGARRRATSRSPSALGIAEPTVKAHLVHIFEKLGVENRTAAALVARELGLVAAD